MSPPGLDDGMMPLADHGEQTYHGFNRLAGKVALITGGDSGIGRAVAIAFAREGANIAINYLPEEETDAQETKRWVQRAGRKCLLLPGDLESPEFCKLLVRETMSKLCSIDILVNNAAHQMSSDKIDDFSREEVEKTFRINVVAMFDLVREAMPLMRKGSSIINTTSIQAYKPSSHLLAYAATKAAIANFTKGLAGLAMKDGIRVNAVAPGPVWTPLIPTSFDKGKLEEFGSGHLYKRPAQPVEIAPVYVFLASDDARYVTGEIYGVTGGLTPL